MISVQSMTRVALAGALCIVSAACGTARPPQDLLDARSAYTHAEQAPTSKLKPAELHVAKESLEVAEKKFMDDGPTQETADLAYVAMRKAQLAESLGAAAAERARKETYEKESGLTKDALLEAREKKLKATEDALASEKGNVAAEKGKTAAEKEKTAAEREQRLAAEKKAKDAMDALSKSLAVRDDARGKVITLSGGVLFATGASTLLPGAQEQLNKVADALKTSAEQHFVVEGHTDSQGTDAVNNELSKKRAEAVRQYLIVRGVAPDSISAVGMGSTRPIADNKTTEGRAMNRRVEIIMGK
jgi:outer membrane protein OmpA-like peptidoglycan-associated protein